MALLSALRRKRQRAVHVHAGSGAGGESLAAAASARPEGGPIARNATHASAALDQSRPRAPLSGILGGILSSLRRPAAPAPIYRSPPPSSRGSPAPYVPPLSLSRVLGGASPRLDEKEPDTEAETDDSMSRAWAEADAAAFSDAASSDEGDDVARRPADLDPTWAPQMRPRHLTFEEVASWNERMARKPEGQRLPDLDLDLAGAAGLALGRPAGGLAAPPQTPATGTTPLAGNSRRGSAAALAPTSAPPKHPHHVPIFAVASTASMNPWAWSGP